MWLVQSSSRDINCEDPNCYILLAGYIFLATYILPADEMNIFVINACRPLEDCMSPITHVKHHFCFQYFFSWILFPLEINFPHFFPPKNVFCGKIFFIRFFFWMLFWVRIFIFFPFFPFLNYLRSFFFFLHFFFLKLWLSPKFFLGNKKYWPPSPQQQKIKPRLSIITVLTGGGGG